MSVKAGPRTHAKERFATEINDRRGFGIKRADRRSSRSRLFGDPVAMLLYATIGSNEAPVLSTPRSTSDATTSRCACSYAQVGAA